MSEAPDSRRRSLLRALALWPLGFAAAPAWAEAAGQAPAAPMDDARDFPLFTTVQAYFYEWRATGLWGRINHHLVILSPASGS